MSVVLDASALLQLWLDPNEERINERLIGEKLHAPAHLRAEALNVIRRQNNAGRLAPQLLDLSLHGIADTPVRLWPFEFVADRVWQLGANATTYDAAYLALAESLEIPLVTHDAKLARVPGIRCSVEVF